MLLITGIVLSLTLQSHALNARPRQLNAPPTEYPGMQEGRYSPAWQNYFLVNSTLPDVHFPLPRNFAGNIRTDRPGHPNNTLFFWAFEKEQGSLTAASGKRATDPWVIWLNGGPGSSSLIGLFYGHGPMLMGPNNVVRENPYSLHQIADVFYIDQPSGTGFSTADATGFVADEDELGRDFAGFLANLVRVFPSLASRPLYLTGESYAGMYIPYISKTLFAMSRPPVKLAKIAIGNGAMIDLAAVTEMPTLSFIETFPQLIDYDPEVYNYFRTQSTLCGYELNVTYPSTTPYPRIVPIPPSGRLRASALEQARVARRDIYTDVARVYESRGRLDKRDREMKKELWKRDLTGRANGTIDPWYGCYLYEEMIDYAGNYTFPWTLGGFDIYNVPSALSPPVPMPAAPFLNNADLKAAIHAPAKDWVMGFAYPFQGSNDGSDPSAWSMMFLSELSTKVPIVFYVGNDDSLVPHRGTEVVIQNMTFGGIQGFTRRPSTPWYDDEGNFAGVIHQERNVTYGLIYGAGHLAPMQKPGAVLTFFREFILGNNQTGALSGDSVIGGSDPRLAFDILPADEAIYYGSATTASTATWADATQSAWANFFATAVPTRTVPAGLFDPHGPITRATAT